ncbi:ankyrin repeat-containing domain protein [Aspergillus granulosus]|uniref:Ankyrin repeat-containing domain protein n=1 Tax=Aspergillus granulosus TaxID=176169 RepID=A0ABR4HF37_9EURO
MTTSNPSPESNNVWTNADTERDDETDRRDIRLLRAARYGWTDLSRTILQQRIPLNSVRREGHTALSLAAKYGHEDMVRLLFEHGADIETKHVDSPPFGGHTPLWFAAGAGHADIVKFLLDAGASTKGGEAEDGRLMPLSVAAVRGHEEVVRILLEAGATPDSPGRANARTAFSYAAEDGMETIVQLFLKHGVDPDFPDIGGLTPLAYAAQSGQLRIVEILLECGVNLESRDNKGSSSVNDLSFGGRTPLSRAAGKGQAAVVRLLLGKGADSNAWDLWRKTPLVYAARNGHLETVRLLLKHDPNPAVVGPEGLTSLEVALREFKKLNPPPWYDEMWELLEPAHTRPQPGFFERVFGFSLSLT